MNLTLIIAIYGAILSTLVAIWKIYQDLQNRPKIKVDVDFGSLLDYNNGNLSETKLIVTARNNGKQSVYLSSVGLRSGKKDLLDLKPFESSCELKGGKSHPELFELEKLKNRQVDFAWYRDETGKIYRSKSINKKLNNYFNQN